MACLDTTLLIDLSGRGGRSLERRASRKVEELRAAGERLTTTLFNFNVAEMWVGVEGSSDPKDEQESVEAILAPLTVLDFEPAAARAFGRLIAHLQHSGKGVGDRDALIASVALVNGEAVITRNPGHFLRVPGLQVESY